MDFFEVVKTRSSVRSFASAAVEDSKVRRILEAANLAPSAGNLQAYEIYTVTHPSYRRALARAALFQDFIASAPLVLVFCAHPARSAGKYKERGARLYTIQDATIACSFAMLAATALGLASVWIGAFNDEAVRKVINAPDGLVPVAVLPVGYPAEQPGAATRRALEDLVHPVNDWASLGNESP
jgi:nitroreductase